MYKRIGDLSAQFESSGDPGSVGMNEGDSGGWSYGIYQFASNVGSVQTFIEWLYGMGGKHQEYGMRLAAAGNPCFDQSFVLQWEAIAEEDSQGFGDMQDEYAAAAYMRPGVLRLSRLYGFEIESHSNALNQVLFSNCIQHGNIYGAEVFKEASELSGIPFSHIDDATLIHYIYETKLTDMSWSSGAPDCRPGLFSRWTRERELALELLSKEA